MRKNIVLVFFIIVALMASTGIVMGQMSQGQMGQQVSDDTIKAQIGKAIQANPRLSIGDVFVDSKSGNVTLSGKVANKDAEKQIIDIAKRTPGVKSVNSKLEVYQQR